MGYYIFYGIMLAMIVFCIIMMFTKPLKNEAGEIYDNFVSGNSFGSIGANQSVKGILKADCLYIHHGWDKKINVSLAYHKITNVRLTSDVEIIEKSKSVGGRALAGGLVLGPAGALFGGLSGIGSKTERKVSNYILISYRPSPEEEEHGILLKVGVGAWDKFMEELKKKANISDEKSVEL